MTPLESSQAGPDEIFLLPAGLTPGGDKVDFSRLLVSRSRGALPSARSDRAGRGGAVAADGMKGRRWRPGRGRRGGDALPSARSGRGGRGGAVAVDDMEGWRWRPNGGGEAVVARRRWILGATAAVAPSPPPDLAGGEAAAAKAATLTSGGFGSGGLFGSEHLVS
ncbi:hypothetical protein OsI_26170 [Oryza sativa Indica Group]|uniref:Uncharacterized protein n=1 Tax=Oryza sativa subsp. indica TaxID=39946 RepID=B8B6L6_ORYSI|nr:hypothetical protein OsI_26170 [Oryza sativa Indica Group]